MIIIGITGTLGAGKGTIVELLKNRGFSHFSVRKFIAQEVESRGLQISRDTLVEIGNDLRAKNSPSYIAEQLYRQASASGKNCVIESLRALGEIEALRQKGKFYLFAIDAEPRLRWQRNVSRASETDKISFEKFIQDEQKEMRNDDPNKQNLSACIKEADYRFLNNGTVEELQAEVGNVLKQIA